MSMTGRIICVYNLWSNGILAKPTNNNDKIVNVSLYIIVHWICCEQQMQILPLNRTSTAREDLEYLRSLEDIPIRPSIAAKDEPFLAVQIPSDS